MRADLSIGPGADADRTDITGRLIEEKDVVVSAPEQVVEMDASGQPGGVYFISVLSGVNKTVYRVSKY